MFGFFKKKVEKEEFEQFKQVVQTGFNRVKQDVSNISKWIKHLDAVESEIKQQILNLESDLSTIKEEFENLRNMFSVIKNVGVFKQQPTVFNKQTVFKGVLNSVQTGVQTVFLNNLSATERAIVFVLLNSDMKLSYEDLAAMLGKKKTTIRGQINSIKQKCEGLIEEVIGENNKKRVYIPDQIKEEILKTKKVKKRKDNKESEAK